MKKKILYIIVIVLSGLIGAGIDVAIRPTENGITVDASYNIEFSDVQVPAEMTNDQGEIVQDENIPTVEEVDGGLFKDDFDADAGDKGWSETYDVSSPDAFKNDTLGKCIIANNYYGAQCVSLARVFWWSYADRDVSTCGTGMAKGMMNCADENAGDDFEIYWRDSIDKIQAGDWLVFDGGMYGHVGMALGGNNNGYVALLGENQGGHSCGANVGGSATNIINISLKNLIGFYRPKAYIKPEPTPEPIPISGCVLWHVERGDTMSKIMMECEGVIKYGEIMNEYAKTWYSLIYRPNQSVYDGWNSPSGVGLYAGDDIEHRMK
ncbi:MAG: hypothetical protein IKA08_00020 [Alphaproteobacteria bacterium]|nr:hypothetical protein [Alphaproteobacteria bacterium]